MKMNLKILVIPGLAVIAAAIGVYYFLSLKGDKGSGSADARPPIPVIVATTGESEFADHIDVIGTAQARESIDVTSKIAEVVASVNFFDGQSVEKDDIIVELNKDEKTAELEEARAALLEAERQYQRTKDLEKRGATTQSRLDAALAQRDGAQARVNAMEALLADYLIRAPFSGVLGLRHVSPGGLVQPGDLITTLDDISLIKFDFSVPEAFLTSLSLGREVKAKSIAYPGRDFIGKVTAIDTRIDPDTRTVRMRAEIDNKDGLLKPGMLLTAELLSNRRRSLAVPNEALLQQADLQFVYVIQQTEQGLTAVRREVQVGRRRPGMLEIISGLSKGEEVIVQGTNVVSDGALVRKADREPSADAKGPSS